MKICIVHNAYGKFSGEEAVVRDHEAVFRSHDCEVVEFFRSSEELHGTWGNVKGLLTGIWNPFSVRRFASFLDREKPDVVHVHNLYPLINPRILQEAKKRGIPVVMTIHNFRLVCPNGLFAVDNHICEECAKHKSVLPCLRHNCLESRRKTLGYALRAWKTCHYYFENVSRFLCLTPFQMQKLVSYGVPENRCSIVPNFIPEAWLTMAGTLPQVHGDYIAYMGRLSEEKGIDLLLDAARCLPDIPFRIAGNGAEAYRPLAPSNVDFVGYVTGQAQMEFLRHARIHVMASRCYENFPTSLLQAMALGIPEVVPAGGPMPDIIGPSGVAFESGQLFETLDDLYHDDVRLQGCRAGALEQIQKFTAESFWKQYDEVIHELLNGKS